MKTRTLRQVACLVVIATGGLLAAMRLAGVTTRTSDGRVVGYSAATGEWLALQYPRVPARIDGPYVYLRDGQRQQLRLDRGAAGRIKATRSPLATPEIEVITDQPRPRRFKVPLRQDHPRGGTRFPMPARVLVASDFEGDLEAFASVMEGNGVLDADWHWRFGDGHVVLVGDLVDRGRNVLPLLWLVYRMEAEARTAGGAVHYLLGNHEHKLLRGRARDVHQKYYATFRLSGQSPRDLWDERSELGRWLRSKPVLLQLGDHLFMHGGVSPEVLALRPTLDDVDRAASAGLDKEPRDVTDPRARALVWDRTGLLWYRGLAKPWDDMPKAGAAHVRDVLRHFGVRHLVIGHTLVEHVGADHGGAVLRVDVDHAKGTREALLLENGAAFRVDAGGRRSDLQHAVNLD